jgi:hypothetical protein
MENRRLPLRSDGGGATMSSLFSDVAVHREGAYGVPALELSATGIHSPTMSFCQVFLSFACASSHFLTTLVLHHFLTLHHSNRSPLTLHHSRYSSPLFTWLKSTPIKDALCCINLLDICCCPIFPILQHFSLSIFVLIINLFKQRRFVFKDKESQTLSTLR